MSKIGIIAGGAALVMAGWVGAMASGCSTAFATSYEEVKPTEVLKLKCALVKRDGLNAMAVEQEFPDRKIADLARIVAVVPVAVVSLGYTSTTTPVMVKDGSVFVLCPSGEDITLIVPPPL